MQDLRSHSSDAEDWNLLRCYAMSTGKYLTSLASQKTKYLTQKCLKCKKQQSLNVAKACGWPLTSI
jgi:hypothetical protein